jgi:hypothetical protein
LADVATQLTAIGDSWREFALQSTRVCKNRAEVSFADLADLVVAQAEREEQLFSQLRAINKHIDKTGTKIQPVQQVSA